MDNVFCIIPTYHRPMILRQTIELLQRNLVYPGEVYYYVSTDAPGDGAVEAVGGLPHVHIWDGPQRGMGANLNFLLDRVADAGGNIILQLDDDSHLVKPIELLPHVIKLNADPTAGVIRLCWIGGHRYLAQLEADQSANQAYWRVRWDSPEHYIASNRPHLKHKRWHEQMGRFPEGQLIGATEEGFCHQCLRRGELPDALSVLIPADVTTESGWQHAGKLSWQSQGL